MGCHRALWLGVSFLGPWKKRFPPTKHAFCAEFSIQPLGIPRDDSMTQGLSLPPPAQARAAAGVTVAHHVLTSATWSTR